MDYKKLQTNCLASIIILSILTTILIGGCRRSSSVGGGGYPSAEPIPTETPPNPISSSDPFFSSEKKVSIVGRTFSSVGKGIDGIAGTADDDKLPVSKVKVTAIINGVSTEITSGTNGEFAFVGVPLRPDRNNSYDKNYDNIVIYFEKVGWSIDTDIATPAVNENYIKVELDASSTDSVNNNFHVDLGPILLTEDELKLTSSLIKGFSNSTIGIWRGGGSDSGVLAAEDDYVFMLAAEDAISLTFNRPMDTNYNTDFLEFYAPNGSPVGFTGTWNTVGNIYTIVPTLALTPDNNDKTKYSIYIARPLRSLATMMGARKEITNVRLSFNVLMTGRDQVSMALTPSFFPQGENVDYTNYVLDNSSIKKLGLIALTGVEDVIADETDFCISFSEVSGAKTYHIFARNTLDMRGIWFDKTSLFGVIASASNENNTATLYSCTLNGASYANLINESNFDSTLASQASLSIGEQVQLIVVPEDYDGNYASINAQSSYLTINDTWNPYLVNIGFNSNFSNELTEHYKLNPKYKLTLNFSESIDTSVVGKVTLTYLSGLFDAGSPLSATQRWFPNLTGVQLAIQPTFVAAKTTLAKAVTSGETYIYVNDISGLKKGMTLLILDKPTGLPVVVDNAKTIAEIDTYNKQIKLSSALGVYFPIGSSVYILDGGGNLNGLTSVKALTTTDIQKSTLSFSVSDAASFYKGQSIKFYFNDSESPQPFGPVTIDSITGNTINLVGPVSNHVPVGALVLDNITTQSEIIPRASVSAITVDEEVLVTVPAASTTLAVNNFTTTPDSQPTVVIVADASAFNIDDMVIVGATDYAPTLTNSITTAVAVATINSHSFVSGDLVHFETPNVNTTVTGVVAVTATAITVASGASFMANDPIVIEDAAVETTASVDMTATNTIKLTSVAGLAVGQTINVNDGVNTAESKVILSITGSDVVVSVVFTNLMRAKARVTRVLISDANAISSVAGTTLNVSATANAYSTQAKVYTTRLSYYRTVSATATNTITLSGGNINNIPSTTVVRLVSMPEIKRISAKTSNLITFYSSLLFTHHKNATLTRQSQVNMHFAAGAGATALTAMVLNDSLVCDSMPSGFTSGGGSEEANADRFSGTILGFDSAERLVTLVFDTSRSSTIYTNNLNCEFMGDALKITNAKDLAGNSIRASWGYRFNLVDAALGR